MSKKFFCLILKSPNIPRKPLETPCCKGFDQRDMLFKHIPFMYRTYPVDLTPLISYAAFCNTSL